MFTGILTATAVVGTVGILIGVFLGVAGMKFKVDVDERQEAIQAALPGNNCGGCGFAGCSGLAAAIVRGDAEVDACPVGGKTVASAIAGIMGIDAKEVVKQVAFVHCLGDCEKTQKDYEYHGVEDCRMVGFVPGGGPKSCNNGCLGFGTCVRECPFEAISIEKGIAVVDREKCKACGKCVNACPKKLISLIPYEAKLAVACNSYDKGPITMKACQAGCIGCGICAKNCPKDAIRVENFHALIDYEKCVGCGICKQKCPKNCIEVLGK